MSGSQNLVVRPAWPELAVLGCAMREDWTLGDLTAALDACRQGSLYPWKRAYWELSRMLFDPQERPLNLQRAALPGVRPADDEIRARYDPEGDAA